MRKLTLLLLFIAGIGGAKAQVNKPKPIPVNDTFYFSHCGEPLIIRDILNNDFAPDSTTLRIYSAYCYPKDGNTSINYAKVSKDSTSIIFTPESAFQTAHIDTIDKYLNIGISYKIINSKGVISLKSGYITLDLQSTAKIDSLSISNINARINPNNNNFWDLNGKNHFFVPKETKKSGMYTSTLWIGGLDENNQLHCRADRYFSEGIDFSQGPLKDDGTAEYDSTIYSQWARTWKVRSAEINEFRNAIYNPSAYPNYQIPEAILTWPAHGDVAKGQCANLAPFVDVDNDGKYSPLKGDYPKIRGDEAIFYMVNDQNYGSKPSYSGGLPLGVEIHCMAYAFDKKEDSALFNSIFFHYDIINRSNHTYHDTYVGNFNDTDLGFGFDDYVGCDVPRSTMYCYNGKSIDGTGKEDEYGANPPIMSISVLKGPKKDDDGLDNNGSIAWDIPNGVGYNDGIVDNEYLGMTSFMYFLNYEGIHPMSAPEQASEYYRSLSGIWKDGTMMQYGGNAHPISGAYGSVCKFMFPGLSDTANWGTGLIEPSPKEWTEKTAMNEPSDRRGLIVSGPFTLSPKETVSLDEAYTFSRNYKDTNNLGALPIMQARIDSINKMFRENRFPSKLKEDFVSIGFTQINNIKIYPNPANDILNITNAAANSSYAIVDIMGNEILNGTISANKSINISELSSGMYFVKVRNGENCKTVKFVKK